MWLACKAWHALYSLHALRVSCCCSQQRGGGRRPGRRRRRRRCRRRGGGGQCGPAPARPRRVCGRCHQRGRPGALRLQPPPARGGHGRQRGRRGGGAGRDDARRPAARPSRLPRPRLCLRQEPAAGGRAGGHPPLLGRGHHADAGDVRGGGGGARGGGRPGHGRGGAGVQPARGRGLHQDLAAAGAGPAAREAGRARRGGLCPGGRLPAAGRGERRRKGARLQGGTSPGTPALGGQRASRAASSRSAALCMQPAHWPPPARRAAPRRRARPRGWRPARRCARAWCCTSAPPATWRAPTMCCARCGLGGRAPRWATSSRSSTPTPPRATRRVRCCC